MPNLTTHINFIKYLTNKKYNNYDLNYLVLGGKEQHDFLIHIHKALILSCEIVNKRSIA